LTQPGTPILTLQEAVPSKLHLPAVHLLSKVLLILFQAVPRPPLWWAGLRIQFRLIKPF
jgi:hypothetical protein